jgi:putative ABC transport system substrate-binding protein
LTVNKRFILTAVLLLLFSTLPASVDRPHIIIIKDKDIAPYTNALQGFREFLNRKNIPFNIESYGTLDDNRISQLNALKPDIILTLGKSVTKLVSRHVTDIPIVFSMVVDPPGSGIRGGNLAGVSLDIPVRIQFEALKELVPGIKTIGVLYNPAENEKNIAAAARVAVALGLKLKPYAVHNAGGIPDLGQLKIDALWFIADTTVCQPPIIKRLLLAGLKNRIPVMGLSTMYVRAGALLALTCEYKDIGRQVGEITERILEGETISTIGIKEPRQTKLVINLAVARRLGLKIPKKTVKEAQVFGK